VTHWSRTRTASLGLRLAGVLLLALAYAAARALRARAVAGPVAGDPLAWLLAAASFVSASGGTALAVMGHHLFDQVQIARRWSRYAP